MPLKTKLGDFIWEMSSVCVFAASAEKDETKQFFSHFAAFRRSISPAWNIENEKQSQRGEKEIAE